MAAPFALSSPSAGVIVTGGASGIGRASVEALAAAGRPVALWDIDGARAGEAASAIRAEHGGAAAAVAIDLARINSVSPGMVVTPMMQPAIDATPAGWFEKRILLERLGRPDEIGRAVRFLMSDEASYITAAELAVDGGNISSQR